MLNLILFMSRDSSESVNQARMLDSKNAMRFMQFYTYKISGQMTNRYVISTLKSRI